MERAGREQAPSQKEGVSVKLISLKLSNFMGIKHFELGTGGRNATVYGENGAGKTTLFSAFLWLLFGKNANNQSDFDIKTLDATGNVLHGLEHEVEATLEIDGRPLVLRKAYKEDWTKKRGSAERTFTGHTTDHFINGVPAKKTEYATKIASICDEETFKLLTSPTYFNTQLHWQKRRDILLEVCGDISDSDVIASDKTLAKLPEILSGRKLDDHRKVIAGRRRAINDEMEKIPIRIDEIGRGLPDISGMQADKLPADIAKLRGLAKEKEQQILLIQNGGQKAEKVKMLRILEGELLRLENEHQEKLTSLAGEKREDFRLTREAIMDNKGDISGHARSIQGYERDISGFATKLEQLRQSWFAENNREFSFNQDETCPTCGQYLPQAPLQTAREKALARFNKEKADKLESINAEGQRLESMKAEMEAGLAHTQQKLEKATADLVTLENEEAALRVEIDAIFQGAQPVHSAPRYVKRLKDKEALEEEIRDLDAGNQEAAAVLQQEINAVNNDIAALESTVAQVEHHKQGSLRIEQLKKQEKDLAKEFEQLENELYLTEQFIRTKVSLLEEKINSRFKMARFKLFDVLVSGGMVECCETLYNGVPYSSGLNNAARINVGLDIINNLAEHYEFSAPIFIDNAEAVTDLIETSGQQIRLIVSAKDKQLRVDVEGSKTNE